MRKTLSSQTSHNAAIQQAYRFEFGSDCSICSVSFRGSMRESELRGMLKASRKTSYEKCGKSIRSYLDLHNLNYSGFTACEKPAEGRAPIELADSLLHAPSCSIIDQYIGNAAVCHCVMDYRHETEDGCEGYYYAIAKIPSAQDGHFQYHVVSQTFCHDASGEKEQSHFAIRRSDSGHQLVTLDEECRFPVLATFGCVDMTGLLISIADITTKQQAAELANI